MLGQFIKLPPGAEATTLYADRFCIVARKWHPNTKGKIDAKTFARLPNIFVGHSGETGITDATLPSRRVVSTVALVPRRLTALTRVSTTDAIATCPRVLPNGRPSHGIADHRRRLRRSAVHGLRGPARGRD